MEFLYGSSYFPATAAKPHTCSTREHIRDVLRWKEHTHGARLIAWPSRPLSSPEPFSSRLRNPTRGQLLGSWVSHDHDHAHLPSICANQQPYAAAGRLHHRDCGARGRQLVPRATER